MQVDIFKMRLSARLPEALVFEDFAPHLVVYDEKPHLDKVLRLVRLPGDRCLPMGSRSCTLAGRPRRRRCETWALPSKNACRPK